MVDTEPALAEAPAVQAAGGAGARLLVNIDVPDLAAGIAFYTTALELMVGRRFGDGAVELLGGDAPIYLLEKAAGTRPAPSSDDARRYDRHWSPIHLDFAVDDLDAARTRLLASGASQEGETSDVPYGRIAMFADPFGHGLCLIQFNQRGYDALLD